jgi:hypothetical protein
MRRHLFLVALLSISLDLISQLNPPNPTAPSANLGFNGPQVDNDLFTGKVNVTIPIYSYTFEGINIPVTLRYNGGNGIKADEVPSWVGLGWDLQASGYVHRTVRGKADEALDFKTIITEYYVAPSYTQLHREKETILHSTDYSYLNNTNKLDDVNWSTAAYASTFANQNLNWPYTNPYGPYGQQTEINKYPTYDLVPDEFSFSAGGVSGTFYLNHQNKWIVVASDNKKYTVAVQTGEQTILDQWVSGGGQGFQLVRKVPRIIKYLTLTSVDGIRYYFGNSDINAPYSQQLFEYSRSSVVLPAPGDPNPQYSPISGGMWLDIVPHTWHLSKIENLRTGSVIEFTYKQQGLQCYKTKQAWGHSGTSLDLVYQNSQYTYYDPENQNIIQRLSGAVDECA